MNQMYMYYRRASKPIDGDYSSLVLRMLQDYAAKANIMPSPAKIMRDTFRRPYVQGSNVDFNYTHTKSALALVVTEGAQRTVGIDMEPLSREKEVADILDVAFNSKELQRAAVSPLRHWTLKEAALKMYGTGFGLADPKEYVVERQDARFRLYRKEQLLLKGWYTHKIIDGNYITICSQKDMGTLRVYVDMMDESN